MTIIYWTQMDGFVAINSRHKGLISTERICLNSLTQPSRLPNSWYQ